jgi:hypothetical protein
MLKLRASPVTRLAHVRARAKNEAAIAIAKAAA